MGDSGCAQVLQKGNAIKFLAPIDIKNDFIRAAGSILDTS